MSVETAVTRDEVVAVLIESVESMPADADAEATFDELDIDSLALLEMAVLASVRFGVRIEDFELQSAATLNGAADVVLTKLGGTSI